VTPPTSRIAADPTPFHDGERGRCASPMTRRFARLNAGPLEAAQAAVAAARHAAERAAVHLDVLRAASPRQRVRDRLGDLRAAEATARHAEAALHAAEQHEREVAARRAGDQVDDAGDDEV
jgi:hypothetical protein